MCEIHPRCRLRRLQQEIAQWAEYFIEQADLPTLENELQRWADELSAIDREGSMSVTDPITLARLEERLRELIAKWRNRAEPNFADPEATDETLAYWSGAKRCADELEKAIEAAAAPESPRRESECRICGGFVRFDGNEGQRINPECRYCGEFRGHGHECQQQATGGEAPPPARGPHGD